METVIFIAVIAGLMALALNAPRINQWRAGKEAVAKTRLVEFEMQQQVFRQAEVAADQLDIQRSMVVGVSALAALDAQQQTNDNIASIND